MYTPSIPKRTFHSCATVLLLCAFTQSQELSTKPNEKVVNDVSRLNPTKVQEVVRVENLEQLRQIITMAAKAKLKVAVAGKRHSQGGQTSYPNAIVLDMTGFNKILKLDTVGRAITVQSGVTWEQIQDYVNQHGLAVEVQQASNIFTVGGSLSVNAHGRDPRFGPLIQTVRGFRLLKPDGIVANVTRTENPELFSLVIGGDGLFGVILDVDLELTTNDVYRKTFVGLSYRDYPKYFEDHIRGDPEVDLHYAWPSVRRRDFLQHLAVYSFTKTTERPRDVYALQHERGIARNRLALRVSRKSARGRDLRWFLQETFADRPGTRIISRNNAMRPEVKFLEYDSPTDTDILQEYFVPMANFVQFMDRMREIFIAENVNLLSITVRYVPRDSDAFLSYAREDSFAFVLYINQELSKAGRERAQKWTQELVDAALKNRGSYYLPYQLYPTSQQVRLAYPQLDTFFSRKLKYDPEELFENNFYAKYKRSIEFGPVP